jgi:ketosteroid isomerase-like protein
MSRENVEIVRNQIDAFNAFMRGELTREAAAELLDPQIEVHWQHERAMAELPQDLRGAAALITYLEERRRALTGLEPLDFIEAPDGRVVTPIRQSFRAEGSSVPLATHFFYVWTIRDGTLRDVVIYLRRADALEAVGLRE